jgi:hypothetical protein
MYGERVNFVGVAGRDDLSAINEFIDTLKVSGFEHAVDEDGSLWRSYDISTQPSFVFINDDGQASSHVGALGVAGLQERLDALVAG